MHDEDKAARRLLAPLAGDPGEPTSVDIQRAVADGRRRLRTRRVAGIGAVAAVAALVAAGVPLVLDRPVPTGDLPPLVTGTPSPLQPSPTGPAAPTACELEYLPVPDGAPDSLTTGGDPTGRFILGRSYHGSPGIRVLVWEDGAEPVPVDIPGDDASLDDVNRHGVAVGTSFRSDGDQDRMAWVYQDGSLSQLAGENVEVSEVSDEGMIVGTRYVAGRGIPVVWRSPAAEPEDLSVPGPSWEVRATGVAVDGTVVGNGSDMDQVPNPPIHSFVWSPDGARREIPWPAIDGKPAGGFGAGSIRDGVVTGLATELLDQDEFTYRLLRYDLRTGEFTDLPARVPFYPESWNAHGWMVGFVQDQLVIQAGTSRVALPHPELPDNPEDRGLYRPIVTLVSDDGRTIAGQVFTEDSFRAVAWRCR